MVKKLCLTGVLLVVAMGIAGCISNASIGGNKIHADAAVSKNIEIYFNLKNEQQIFSVEHIAKALKRKGYSLVFKSVDILNIRQGMTGASAKNTIFLKQNLTVETPVLQVPVLTAHEVQWEKNLKPEGFYLSVNRGDKAFIRIKGYDNAGVMYGGLELAEQLNIYGLDALQSGLHNPYMEKRGTKFNIPLDARTPSYSDMSDVAQHNISTVWDFAFWRDYLDDLARYRYNFVSLWNLHPFPSMVKVPGYPDIALDDVKKINRPLDEYYSTQAKAYDAPELMENLITVKSLSIEEKIQFWQKVMEYAAKRNIEFYLITWNIFNYGTQGQYGITDDINNETTIDYFRQSVKQMFVHYPLLAGMGLTTGENMPEASFSEKEEWAFETYGKGVLDAANAFPDRKITFVHRQHQAGAQAIAKQFSPLLEKPNIDFIFSFKYAQAHVYSSTKQHFHHEFLGDIGNMKTIWTLRNDDVYLYRWGAPDFVREFIQNIPYEPGRGYYYGSDQYVWGREFLNKAPQSPRELEIKKHWYQWLLWGRLGYSPDLDNERLTGIVGLRFPSINENILFDAWQEASMVYPLVTGFHWGEYDFQWYIEACKSRPGPAQTESGFHDVNRFITLPPHKSTGYISIPDYVRSVGAQRTIMGVTPPELAAEIHANADKALAKLQALDYDQQNNNSTGKPHHEELLNTISDIRTIAWLGKYYGDKIQGATALAMYRATKDPSYQREAIAALASALGYWNKYVALSKMQYRNPFLTNRVGHIDWNKLTEGVKNDIVIVENE